MQGSSNVSGLHVPHQCLCLMGKAAEHEDHSPHQGPSDDGKRGDDDHHFIVFIALPVHIQPHQKPLKPNRFPTPFMSRSNPHSESLPDKPHPKLKHITPPEAQTHCSTSKPWTSHDQHVKSSPAYARLCEGGETTPLGCVGQAPCNQRGLHGTIASSCSCDQRPRNQLNRR